MTMAAPQIPIDGLAFLTAAVLGAGDDAAPSMGVVPAFDRRLCQMSHGDGGFAGMVA
jgi:hypothetical protein